MTNEEKARQIIEDNIYCTVATTSTEGKPWVSPLFFAYDENYNIYWVSNKNSQHSTYIRDNPRVAIAIFNSQAPEGEGDGVYFEAKAHELKDRKEVAHAIKICNKRITKDAFRIKRIEDVINESAWRIYKAVPIKVYGLGDGEFINGHYVDKRIEINLW